ncbi:hypothetical protein [Thorsellia anophelis]|uniref:Hydroxymethylpyrimidine pyrophosphatase n=1 Tax=Thorsellia anophelis DSM 18579 TaxID=1123402 RepID=A0A1I0ENN7_9GAMM|nr:hypothetical protein [Thorsellia anophelis]SET46897.1 Hydroxymethylpyrimidine pyrophosphatase [Thorsellia anophelis DSM 18579]
MFKPIFLCDLDDTLFQTQRKITEYGYSAAFKTAAIDQTGKARSFMTKTQYNWINWLLTSTQLIPITARGTEEISRVQISFQDWKITTHGAVILDKNNQPDIVWREHIELELAKYQDILKQKQALLEQRIESSGIDAWVRMNTEYDKLNIYLVAKHRDSKKIEELYQLCNQIDKETGLEGFYVHRNSNNIAWLPNCIEKGHATRFLLSKLRELQPDTPVLGLGDSVSDHTFLKQCDWFGMPSHGQLFEVFNSTIKHN